MKHLVSMPVRAFLDSDVAMLCLRGVEVSVSMPVRAFLDSDCSQDTKPSVVCRGRVSMPVRAFLDSDTLEMIHSGKRLAVGFNARQGIS